MPKKILVILPFIVTLASPALANSVAQSQRMLNQLGYNAGPVDGAYGGKTRGALEKFYAEMARYMMANLIRMKLLI